MVDFPFSATRKKTTAGHSYELHILWLQNQLFYTSFSNSEKKSKIFHSNSTWFLISNKQIGYTPEDERLEPENTWKRKIIWTKPSFSGSMLTSWWLQPIWKIWVKLNNWIISPRIWVNIKHLFETTILHHPPTRGKPRLRRLLPELPSVVPPKTWSIPFHPKVI